jgi:hypothetical protein
VRRDKAAFSSGCKRHPATAPARSNPSSYEGDEIAKAFGKAYHELMTAGVQAATRVKRRASLEKVDARADPMTLSSPLVVVAILKAC